MPDSTLPPPLLAPTGPPAGSPPPAQPPSAGSRLAWLISGAVLAIAALGWGTYNVLSALAHETRTEMFTIPLGDVTTLDVRNDDGSVTVIGVAGAERIEVTAVINDGWRPGQAGTRVVGDIAEVRGKCPVLGSPWCSVDFTVVVPADTRVIVDAANGQVTVRDTVAVVTVDNDNGRIELVDLGGPVIASNDNGSVVGEHLTGRSVDAATANGRIELTFTSPPDRVTARADNGSVTVAVPGEVTYRVDMSTGNGSTDNRLGSDPTSERVLDLSTDNGSITVRPLR